MNKYISDQIEGLKQNRDALAKSLQARRNGDAPADPQVMADEARDIAKFEERIKALEPAPAAPAAPAAPSAPAVKTSEKK